MYKDLYKEARRIKRKGPTRKPRDLARYTSIASIELPDLVDQPSKKQRKTFLKRYCEELRSKMGRADFKLYGELQRNAAWLVGRKPQIACNRPSTECDGTVSVLKPIGIQATRT